MEMVCFRLPGHGDVALSNMNSLREQLHFCDITIMAGGRRMFRGHKVVLAACSAYLRDQFLLNPSSELQQVSVLHNSTVMRELLQSCYTGILQFSAKEIVNYLTAASYLQMEHVVEKCRGALSRYLQPKNDSPLGPTKAEDSQSIPVIVSGSAAAASEHSSSLQPHSSEEDPQAAGVEDPNVRQGDDDLSMRQIRASDPSGRIQEEDIRNDFSMFHVHIKDDHQDLEDAVVHARAREALEAMVVQQRGEDQNREESGTTGSSQRPPVRYWRRRYGEPRRARGRGFKHRRRYTFHERRPMATFQQAWRFPTSDEIMGSFGADISPDYLAAHAIPDGPLALEYQQAAEGQGTIPGSDSAPPHFNMDGSGTDEDLGVVAVPTDEEGRGDDSVVGSTSCVTGTVACEHCGLAFSSVQDLAVHSRSTHLLYVCPCCGKHFSHSSNLSRHMVVHRTSKLHTCPLCHKTFTQKSTLCDHMNMHSGERPHVCAFCHVCFAHKPALRRHLKEQHGKTTAQNYIEIQRESEGIVGGDVLGD
ncbi:zinc finger and BTB domain-containing protein 12-like isoform X1 [Astyanax mexicanus]|uniref:Zinc finger and BTB domain containing 12 n=1 Tax=Astyanax mexicanus TaxID=7994 RepID=A0A8B9JVH8_ASTMX|nr:zinc finger and BTB domain-containing protein 12-like isoform X1 [Astyanax mexicanus]